MAILFAASELEAFQWIGNPGITTSANDVDLSHVRCGITLQSHTVDSISATFAADGDLWIHYNLGSGDNTGNADFSFLDIFSGSTVLFRIKYLDGIPSFQYWDGAAFQTVSTGVFQQDFTMDIIDLRIKMDNSDGILEFYVNNNLVGNSFTGDTIFTAATTVDNLAYQHPDPDGSFSDNIAISELVVSNERVKFLQTLGVSGDGFHTDFTGSFGDIDENNVDDADLITSSVANQISTFTHDALPALAVTEKIGALVTSARIRNTGVAPDNTQFITRSGGTDFLTGNISGLVVGYNPFQNIEADDPKTAAEWSVTNINSAEFGLKSIT